MIVCYDTLDLGVPVPPGQQPHLGERARPLLHQLSQWARALSVLTEVKDYSQFVCEVCVS